LTGRGVRRAPRRTGLAVLAAAMCVAGFAAAEWLAPDPSLREAQFALRLAARDTAGHADDPGRLDSLGVAQLRLGLQPEAQTSFARALALRPGDDVAEAGLGKLAMFAGRLDRAESLLAGADALDPGARADLFALRMRRGDWTGAVEVARDAQQEGRIRLLEALAATTPYEISGPEETSVRFRSAYPVPLVRVKLNGRWVLMAIDTGVEDVLLDDSSVRRDKVQSLPAQYTTFWMGTRTVVRGAILQQLEIGDMKLRNVPAASTSLRRWSLEVNPHGERVAGIIGIGVLRRFTPTLDFKQQRLTLRREAAPAPDAAANIVPFQLWGIAEMMVEGSMAGGRRMEMVIQSGVPGCGVGAPVEVFEELGLKPGTVSKLVKGAGSWLSGRPWSELSVPAVVVGPVARDKVPGWQGALDSGELWRHGVRRDALLSNDFFRDLSVTIDWDQQTLAFLEE